MHRLGTIGIVCLTSLAGSAFGQKPVGLNIDEKTIVAYEKHGARYGEFRKEEYGIILFISAVTPFQMGSRGFGLNHCRATGWQSFPR
jgi:hypothetical protein